MRQLGKINCDIRTNSIYLLTMTEKKKVYGDDKFL